LPHDDYNIAKKEDILSNTSCDCYWGTYSFTNLN